MARMWSFMERPFRRPSTTPFLSGDYTFVHAYDDEQVIAGQGTVCLEIIR